MIMKLITLIIMFVVASLPCFSQASNKAYERAAEKYSVQKITVSGRTFSVGDTITLGKGSGPSGEFISGKLFAISADPLPVSLTGRRFIVLKIYHSTDGLNSFSQLVCPLAGKQNIYIDPGVAIARKEIE